MHDVFLETNVKISWHQGTLHMYAKASMNGGIVIAHTLAEGHWIWEMWQQWEWMDIQEGPMCVIQVYVDPRSSAESTIRAKNAEYTLTKRVLQSTFFGASGCHK